MHSQSQQDDSCLYEQDQQVLSMIHDSSGKLTYLCLYSNEVLTSLLYLLQKEHNPQVPPREYLQRMLSIAYKDAARARVVARGPMFPPK